MKPLATATKEALVAWLKELSESVERKDPGRFITFFSRPPGASDGDLLRMAARLPEEVTPTGAALPAAQGQFGTLEELAGDRGLRWAATFKVPAAEVWVLPYNSAEVAAHWTGREFPFIRIDDLRRVEVVEGWIAVVHLEQGAFNVRLGLAAPVVHRLRQRPGDLLKVSAALALLTLFIQAPLLSAVVRLLLARAGHASIGNFEIAQFVLSARGAFSLLVVVGVALALAYLSMAALLAVVGESAHSFGATLRGLARQSGRVLRLGLCQATLTTPVAAPLVAWMAFALKQAWGDSDINGLLIVRPPEFWQGVHGALPPALLLLLSVVYLGLRWLLALPLLVADATLAPWQALRASAGLTRGRHVRHVRALGGYLLLCVVPLAISAWLVQWTVGAALSALGADGALVVPATALLLTLGLLLLAVLSWLATAALAVLLDALMREAQELPLAQSVPAASRSAPRAVKMRLACYLIGIGALSGLVGFLLLNNLALNDGVEVTAHRAGAIRAPENTLAALRLAIEEGARWAEIDVQRTLDDQLVILHDTDLSRLGAGNKRVRETTLAELKTLDVGTALGFPAFAGERVATLQEFFAAAGDAIRLNVELKPAGAQDVEPLTDQVVAAVLAANQQGRCRICSQSYPALRRAKDALPTLTVGWIAGASLGDITKLDVDFLMLNAGLITRSLVDRAHARGQAVHAWTVNDTGQVLPLVDLGVDNIITDDPAAVAARLAELRTLTTPARVLLRARSALAR